MANVNGRLVLNGEAAKTAAKAASAAKEYETYTIKSGDSLSSIANRYGMTQQELADLNGIKNPNKIKAGTKIKVKSNKAQGATKTAPTPASTSAATAKKPAAPIPMTGDSEIGPPIDSFERHSTVSAVAAAPTTQLDGDSDLVSPNYSVWKPPAERRAEKEKDVLAITEYNAKKMEGLRKKAYTCTSGKWTIGYGHTEGVKKGDTIDATKALEHLRTDLKKAHDALKEAIPIDIYDKLSNYQLAALTDICFNMGIDGFKETDCYKLVCAGKFDEAQTKMDVVYGKQTNKDGNVVKDKDGNPVMEIKPGLLTRRVQEMYLYGNGELTDATDARVKALVQEEMSGIIKQLNENGGKVTIPIKSLRTAGKEMYAELLRLETKYQKEREKNPKLKPDPLLQKMRNRKALFEVLKDPQEFLAATQKAHSGLARN